MDVAPFALERWLARYETEAEVMLGESGIRSLSVDRFDLEVEDLGYVLPTDGDPGLREHLGGRHGRSAAEVVLTCGTQEANLLVHLALLGEGAHAVVVTPTYQSLRTLPSTFASVTAVTTSPPAWSIDVDRVAEAMRPETAAIVLANPANPTGRYEDEGTLRALHALAVDHDAYLHVDEVYRLLVDDPEPPAASLGERAISTGGVSKAHGLAGARLGWVCAPHDVADAVRRWKDYTTIAPPRLGQHIAAQALIDQEADILEANRRLARRNRGRTAAFLEAHDLDWFEPSTVVGFPTIPTGFDTARSFCEQLYEETGVLLAPGDVFGVPDRFRIGFGTASDELERGLDRLSKFIGEGDSAGAD
ncbi:MAG: aminotransferase class I/II-fold pyridoxal phosphate-dependent enzyme [Halobacteriota archaeon]